jgi:hypothetical protein
MSLQELYLPGRGTRWDLSFVKKYIRSNKASSNLLIKWMLQKLSLLFVTRMKLFFTREQRARVSNNCTKSTKNSGYIDSSPIATPTLDALCTILSRCLHIFAAFLNRVPLVWNVSMLSKWSRRWMSTAMDSQRSRCLSVKRNCSRFNTTGRSC